MGFGKNAVATTTSGRTATLGLILACLTASASTLAQPTMTKAFSPTSVQIGQTSSLSFTITNPAASAISAVAFTDTFPANLFVATPNNLTGSCGAGTITAVAGSGSVSLSGGTIAASGSCTFAIDVIVLHQNTNNPTAYVNTTGAVSATSGVGNTATDTLTANSGTFAVAKGFSPNSIVPGGVSTLTFTVTSSQANAAFTNQVANVVFQDVLPAGVVVATPNGLAPGTCSAATITATAGSNTITLGTSLNNAGGNTGGLSFGASGGGGFDTCSFSVDVTAASAGTYVNTVTQSIGGSSAIVSNNGNNGSATLVVAAPLPPSIAKAFNPASIPVNGTSVLTLTITNPAANTASLTGVAVTDNLPAGLVVATPDNLTNDCGGSATAAPGSGVVSLTGGTIAANGVCAVTLNVTATAAGTYSNTTDAVTSTNGGAGNTASATLSVLSTATVPVPASSGPALALVALLLAGFGLRGLLRKRTGT